MSTPNNDDDFYDAISYNESDSDEDYQDSGEKSSDEEEETGQEDARAWVVAKLEKNEKEREKSNAIVVYDAEIQKLRDLAEQVKRARIKQETRQQYNNTKTQSNQLTQKKKRYKAYYCRLSSNRLPPAPNFWH